MNLQDDAFWRKLAERQEKLFALQPICPKCGSPQVQLTNRNPPAKWRCRICKHHFNKDYLEK